MARVTINDSILTDIADAIREKTETEDSIAVTNMADMISAISGGDCPFAFNDYATATLMSDGKELVFENPLGVVPSNFYIVPANVREIVGVSAYKVVSLDYMSAKSSGGCSATSNNKQYRSGYLQGVASELTDETITISFTTTTYNFMGGVEYCCLIWE